MNIHTVIEHTLYFLEILAACLVAVGIERWWDWRKNRALDIGCDYCEECKPLNRTPDKSGYLCRKCMDAFLREHDGEFTEEQVTKARKVYRRLRRKR